MDEFSPPTGPPPPRLPDGWKAVWSNEYNDRFYVNLHTKQSTWNKPTEPAQRPQEPEPTWVQQHVNDGPLKGTNQYDSRANYPDPGLIRTFGSIYGGTDKIYIEHSDKVPVVNLIPRKPLRTQGNVAIDYDKLVVRDSHSGLEVPDTRELDLLSDYDFDHDPEHTSMTGVQVAWSSKHACRVIVKRYNKNDETAMSTAWREIVALSTLSDVAIPRLLDHFDPQSTMFVIVETRDDLPLPKFIRQHMINRGSFPEDLLKSLITQLFSAIAVIFRSGFAHLRICDETLYIDRKGQLNIKDFEYAHEYGKERTKDFYAATNAKYGSDIYVAPEVLTTKTYNARKAVIWSCGVVIYSIATGNQTSYLKHCLSHPSFDRSNLRSLSDATPEAPPRRHSLFSRKSSTSSPSLMRITYPTSRLDIPSYVRDIVSKMLIVDPLKRAELIEVAAKVPKEVAAKQTRPLMELAWLDYKMHVGPLAGMAASSKGMPELAGSSIGSASSLGGWSGNGSGHENVHGYWGPRRGYSVW